MAIGDSAGWQVTPNKRANLLFVKPQQAKGRTNLTVVTDQHTYLFDLVAAPKGARPLYTLQFTYPARPPAPPEPAKLVVVAEPAIASAPSPVDLNFKWTQKGAKRLLPDRLFDDGKATYLTWAPSAAIPAMLTFAADGTEGPVNYSVKGDVVVVDGVPGRLVLRAGKESATLERDVQSSGGSLTSTVLTAER